MITKQITSVQKRKVSLQTKWKLINDTRLYRLQLSKTAFPPYSTITVSNILPGMEFHGIFNCEDRRFNWKENDTWWTEQSFTKGDWVTVKVYASSAIPCKNKIVNNNKVIDNRYYNFLLYKYTTTIKTMSLSFSTPLHTIPERYVILLFRKNLCIHQKCVLQPFKMCCPEITNIRPHLAIKLLNHRK